MQISQKSSCVWSLFFAKVQAFRPATLLKKTSTQVFSCEIWEILKNIFFEEHLNDCFCVLITLHILIFTTSTVDVFDFSKYLLLYYAIKTIELMARAAVSFEEAFHWTKFLAFEKLKISFTDMFHESVKKQLIRISCKDTPWNWR